jgi:GINS complex subunit 2
LQEVQSNISGGGELNGLWGRERDVLKSLQRAHVQVPEAGLLGEGERCTFNHLCELSLGLSYLTPGADPGNSGLSSTPPMERAEGEWSPFEVGEEGLLHEESELEAEEDTLVTIVPSFQAPTLQLLRGPVGPFRPQVPLEVPLWMALLLRRRGRCRLKPPTWLAQAALEELLEREREAGQRAFAQVPFRYLEIGTQILKHARDDLEDPEGISDKLETLRERRAQKLHSGLRSFDPDSLPSQVPRLDRLSSMEVSLVRRFFTASLRRFYYHLASSPSDPDNQQSCFNQPSTTSAPSRSEDEQEQASPSPPQQDATVPHVGNNQESDPPLRRELPGR